MNKLMAVLTGAGFGAGAMYLFDPDLGARRRALVRDQVARLPNAGQEAAAVTARDLKNRAIGIVSEARARLFENYVDDDVLADRVRSQLGFLVRHPSALEVKADDGRIILSGPVLSDEIEQLVEGVRAVRGVRSVENRLDVHAEPGSVPGLQGDKPKPTGQPLDLLQRRWSPATRFLVGAGGAFLFYSVARHPSAAIASGSLLLALLACNSTERAPRSRSERRGRRSPVERENEPASAWST
jgi:hypothetical protein